MCTHSTDLCSICVCFCFVYQYYSVSDVEAQMSVIDPTQLKHRWTAEKPSDGRLHDLSWIALLLFSWLRWETQGKRMRSVPFVCCAVTLCKLWSLNVLYTAKKKNKRKKKQVRSRCWGREQNASPLTCSHREVCLWTLYRQYMEEEKKLHNAAL